MKRASSDPLVQYGLFFGVFTPSILTILGAIMYLRIGWVVGNTSLYSTVSIVVLANVITLITALSVSSLATSQRGGDGGAYMLVSRAVGVEMGGAIGFPLYLSQTVSLTLYCYALAEALRMVWLGAPLPYLAAFFIVVVTAAALKVSTVVRTVQVVLLSLVVLSVVSLCLGAEWQMPIQIPKGNYSAEDATGFWQVFAVFFPAVTGILIGLSLSSDLRDPERALPLGTLAAVLLGFVVYLLVSLALLHHQNPSELRSDPLIWLQVASHPALVVPGLFAAILSSAFASVLAAAKTLKALADDGIIPSIAGNMSDGKAKNALVCSAGIALFAVALGDLNSVAIVATMLFLTTYCMINVVAGLEGLVGNPSFRPSLQISWAYSLVAAFGCFLVMTLIHPLASVLAILLEGIIYFYISRRTLESTWGDMRGGIMMAVSRWALLAYKRMEEHRRNWRPHILIFSSDVSKNLPMIQLASDLSMGRGIVTVAQLRTGNMALHEDLHQEALDMDRFLVQQGIDAFCEVDLVHDIPSGVVTVAQANGIAGMHSNTLMMGWPSSKVFPVEAAVVMRTLDGLGKSLLMTRFAGFSNQPEQIDVWWSGTYENGDLMLLLAHLLRQSKRWRGAHIHLKTAVEDNSLVLERQGTLEKICRETRIQATCQVLQLQPEQSINSIIVQHSKYADLVILGLRLPKEGHESSYGEWYTHLVEGLDNVMLVRNSGPFRGELL